MEKCDDFSSRAPMLMAIRGLLRASEQDRASKLIDAVLDEAQRVGWDTDKIARFLALANDNPATWNIAARMGQEVENAYWRVCGAGFWLRDDEAAFDFALRRLVAVRRPRRRSKLATWISQR